MTQKPVLRGEVGCACVAREVSVERGDMGERGCATHHQKIELYGKQIGLFRYWKEKKKHESSATTAPSKHPDRRTAVPSMN